jgi:prolyl-tRNA editing enzyme YbaK/EbsC (Cys-tRNA(Pro) deacylase)
MNSKPYPDLVQRTVATAAARGIACEVIPHTDYGKTTAEAVVALGVGASALIKTLVLMTREGFAVAVIAGNERLDFKAVAWHLGSKKVRMASPREVKDCTGHDIGGVPPIIFAKRCPVLVSVSLLARAGCIGSAGDDRHGLKLNPKELLSLGYCFERIATVAGDGRGLTSKT